MSAENLCQGTLSTLNTIAGILRGIHQVTELTPSPRDTETPTSLAGWWGFSFLQTVSALEQFGYFL